MRRISDGRVRLADSYATEYNHAVKLTVWDDGFTHDITGRVHYVDSITHEVRIEVKPGEFEYDSRNCCRCQGFGLDGHHILSQPYRVYYIKGAFQHRGVYSKIEINATLKWEIMT
ncbi:YolD-like family protein [Bacillus safensis]|uniref:YolD-like family protein n=1 Tax=Bacillus safensis TaxID=561879 RepID=UPI002FBE9891